MEKKFENNLAIGKFLILLLIWGVSFCFAADVLTGFKEGFFQTVTTYVVPIVVFFTLILGIGMVAGGVDWKYAVAITAGVIVVWVVFSDESTLTNSIKATQNLAKSWF